VGSSIRGKFARSAKPRDLIPDHRRISHRQDGDFDTSPRAPLTQTSLQSSQAALMPVKRCIGRSPTSGVHCEVPPIARPARAADRLLQPLPRNPGYVPSEYWSARRYPLSMGHSGLTGSQRKISRHSSTGRKSTAPAGSVSWAPMTRTPLHCRRVVIRSNVLSCRERAK